MEIYQLTISFPYYEDDIPWSKTIEVKENFAQSNTRTILAPCVSATPDSTALHLGYADYVCAPVARMQCNGIRGFVVTATATDQFSCRLSHHAT